MDPASLVDVDVLQFVPPAYCTANAELSGLLQQAGCCVNIALLLIRSEITPMLWVSLRTVFERYVWRTKA